MKTVSKTSYMKGSWHLEKLNMGYRKFANYASKFSSNRTSLTFPFLRMTCVVDVSCCIAMVRANHHLIVILAFSGEIKITRNVWKPLK